MYHTTQDLLISSRPLNLFQTVDPEITDTDKDGAWYNSDMAVGWSTWDVTKIQDARYASDHHGGRYHFLGDPKPSDTTRILGIRRMPS